MAAGTLFALLVAVFTLAPAPGGVELDTSGATGASDVGVRAALQAGSVVADVGSGSPAGSIVVDVEGAVARPGLVQLPPGSRVGDAIRAAGGFGPRADLVAASEALNLAEPLQDGAKVSVPELGRSSAPAAVRGDAPAGGGRLDLNEATQAELEDLPGVGPVTAGRILDARAQQAFGSVDDLRSRGLVGQSVFEDIKDLVTARR
jgi:competence protein ComEA